MIPYYKNVGARDWLAYAAILSLCIGFVWSRSMYSFGLLFMGLYWVIDVKQTFYIWRNPYFLSALGIALIVPVSDLINGASMSEVFFIKLSLPLFIAFFESIRINKVSIAAINRIVIIVLFATSCIAVLNFIFDSESVNKGYIYAKVMSIGKYSDHIRISVAIVCSIMLAWYEYVNSSSKALRLLMALYIIGQVIFIHFLAARTGLVMLYAMLGIYALQSIIVQKKVWALAIIGALIVLPVVSFYTFPSFYHRIGFTYYETSFYQKMEYREGSSDGLRYYSMKAGMDIFENHKFIGVGYEQLPKASADWLISHFPKIKSYELLQPSSEYILIMAASGIVGFIVLMAYFLLPFVNRQNRRNSYFLSIYTSLLCIMIFEIFLENQYGCFVFGFFTSLAYSMVQRQSTNKIDNL
jgi:O-antigen ligase